MYVGLGIIKFMPGDPNNILDLVPADYVVNQILASISFVCLIERAKIEKRRGDREKRR